MRLYIRICAISALIMLVVIGGYSLLFESEGEEVEAVNGIVEETDIEAAIRDERRHFVAAVCDAVCGNSPYLCKVAFCSVILNRIESPAFPNTASETVFSDEVFLNAYDIDYSREPSRDALMAYDDAVKGFSPCPEALYYTTTEDANLGLKRRLTLFQIGKYIFS